MGITITTNNQTGIDTLTVQTTQPGVTNVLTVQVPGTQGPPGAFKMGTVTTGAPGTNASATTTTDPTNANVQVVNLTIPRGYGVIPAGGQNDVLIKNSPTDYDTAWETPTGTGSLIRQSYVDSTAGTSAVTANALVRRDANGSFQAASVTISNAPSAVSDAVRKDYVDSGDLNAAGHPLPVWNSASTSATGNATGYWWKVATITITTNYHEANLGLIVMGSGGGNTSPQSARVTFRVKQQAALGSSPYVSATVYDIATDGTSAWDAGHFMTIQESIGSSSSVVSLWVKNDQQNSTLYAWEEFTRITTGGSDSIVYATNGANGVAAASLPAGTQTLGVLLPNDSLMAGATSAVTASTLMMRDSSSNTNVNRLYLNQAAPVGVSEATRKDYVDGKTWLSSAISDAASAPTASVIIKRDANGRAQVADPSASADIATKNYADTKASIAGDLGGTAASPQVTSGANHTHTSSQVSDATSNPTPNTIVKRDASGYVELSYLSIDNAPTAAGNATRKDYVDGLATIAGANRVLMAVQGSGTAFPTTSLKVGDNYFRTDLGTNGSLWTYVGGSSGSSGWIHKGPIVCTSTTRPSVTYTGLEVFETDTKLVAIYVGSSWSYFISSSRVTARATATQAIASSSAAPVALTFGAASGVGWASANPTRLTAMAGAGDYDLSVMVAWPANATGVRGIAYRISDGTTTGGWQWMDNKAASDATWGSEQTSRYPGITLTATQFVEVGVWQSSGASLTLSVNSSEASRAGFQRVY